MIAYRSVESETEQLWDSPGRLSKGEEAEEKENAGEGGCGEGYHWRPIIRPPFFCVGSVQVVAAQPDHRYGQRVTVCSLV